MTILASILCRAFGHKPYEHPHIVWEVPPDLRGYPLKSTPIIVMRCKRCGVKLGARQPHGDEWTIEA